MEHALMHANLTESARDFLIGSVRQCPNAFRPREILWQLKLMSRYTAERTYFETVLQKKRDELAHTLPIVKPLLAPPPRSIPLSHWRSANIDWPDPIAFLTKVFLHQILNSSELLLDMGSRTDAFFLLENRDFVGWVPESCGTRWHEPFRSELARLYLGLAFDQERLIEMSLAALHLTPLSQEVLGILSHWHASARCSSAELVTRFRELLKRADDMGLHLHPNILVWGLYELEIVEVFSSLGAVPDLENSADELCRLHSRVSA